MATCKLGLSGLAKFKELGRENVCVESNQAA